MATASLSDLDDLFVAEQDRPRRAFDGSKDQFLRRSLAAAQQELNAVRRGRVCAGDHAIPAGPDRRSVSQPGVELAVGRARLRVLVYSTVQSPDRAKNIDAQGNRAIRTEL